MLKINQLTLFAWAFWGWLSLVGGGGGGGEVPAACNSKTINNNEMKFGGVVKDHQLINWRWRHHYVIMTS